MNGARPQPLLRVDEVNTYYGQIHILQGVSLEVGEGELVCLLGGNASGKSTTLKTILGIVAPRSGTVEFAGEDVTDRSTSYRIGCGMAIVPENRRVFAPMTVLENLEMGAYLERDPARMKAALDRVYATFPILAERRRQRAGSMSGGEQQMVAIGRALMARPRLLAIDELSLGLAPLLVQSLAEFLVRLNEEEGVAILLVDQSASLAFSLCERAYVLETGRIVLDGASRELEGRSEVRSAYLGGGSEGPA